MPFILLVRHGENDYVKKGKLAGRLPGVHLNEKGVQQAQAVAERLKKAPIKAIYSSPLERAVETAQPLAEALGMEIVQLPGLLETDYGEWQDQSLKKLSRQKSWKIVQSNPSLWRFPGGETFADCQRRFCAELEQIIKKHEPKDLVVVVAHADPIKLAVAYFIGLPLDNFQRLGVSPGSITSLFMSETGCHLHSLNYSLELPG